MLLYLEMLAKKKGLKKGAVLYFNTQERKVSGKGKLHLVDLESEDLLKQYKMEGWVLQDERQDVMYGIDQNYRDSQIAHMRYVKSRDAVEGHLLDEASWDQLLALVFSHLHTLTHQCFEEGDIRIYPSGSPDSAIHRYVDPCPYCDYKEICLKDPFYHDFREVQVYTKAQVESILRGEDPDESSESAE